MTNKTHLEQTVEGAHVVGIEPDGVTVVRLGHLEVFVTALSVLDLSVPDDWGKV